MTTDLKGTRRYLGIDYGSKRVGIALSDSSGTIAQPYKVLSNSKRLLDEVLEIIQKEKVDEVVVGESKDFKGNENKIMELIAPFVESLKTASGLPVHAEPEFLTSHQAQYFQGQHDMLDASSAAIILQSYLDSYKRT